MLKIRDDIGLKELEKFGFKVFDSLFDNYLIATRDSTDDKYKSWQFYRVSVNTKDRIFNKTKYRGCGKCLLTMTLRKNDIQDLIEAGFIEKV